MSDENIRGSSVNGSYEPASGRLILGNGHGQSGIGTEQPRTTALEDHFAVDWSREHIPDDGRNIDDTIAYLERELGEKLERLNRTHSFPHQSAEKANIARLLQEGHTLRVAEASALRLQRARNAQNAAANQQAKAEREVRINQLAEKRADELEVEEIAQKIRAERRAARRY